MRISLHCRRGCAPALLLLLSAATPTLANHGPGASGGGSNTLSGETMPQGKFALSLREDYSQFEHFSAAAAAARAASGGDFDALNHGFITSVSAEYGLTDYLQLGLATGFFYGRDFISASQDGADTTWGTANPAGMTDLALSAKLRLYKGPLGNLALATGVTLPTGKSDVRLSNGERLSPTDQPGTGRFGLPIGLAYSRYLTAHVTLDASVLYTAHFEKDLFKVGDRLDTGIAIAWRLTDSINTFPQYSLFAEINDVCLMRDRDAGASDPNSGSNTLYLTPGLRVRFDSHTSMTIAPSVPLWQQVNGDQGTVLFKLAVSVSYSF